MTATPVTVRPSKTKAPRPVISVARGHYFERGGFTVSGETVTVVGRSGRRSEVPIDKIAAVVLTASTRGDSRVLLTDKAGAVLTQDSGYFYRNDDLDRLARAIGRPFVVDPYRNFNDLAKAHPGALRYRWERHPSLWGLALAPVIIGVALGIGYLIQR